jgi:hypothetical protein
MVPLKCKLVVESAVAQSFVECIRDLPFGIVSLTIRWIAKVVVDKFDRSGSRLGAANIIILEATTRTVSLESALVEVFGMLTSLRQLNLM